MPCRIYHGHQETLYLAPLCIPGQPCAIQNDSKPYTLEIALWSGDPKYGGGGSFPVTFDISNATAMLPLLAMAGPDQQVTADSSGYADVTLDGSGSTGPIVTYEWSNGVVLATIEKPTLSLALGDHTITLKVADGPVSSSDTVFVKVKEAKGGGGPGRGEKCFKNKEPLCP